MGSISTRGLASGPRTRWVKTVQTVIRTTWFEVDDTHTIDGIFMSWKGAERNAIHRDEYLTEECVAEIVSVKPEVLK